MCTPSSLICRGLLLATLLCAGCGDDDSKNPGQDGGISTDGSSSDSGSTSALCQNDTDCLWRVGGCCGICSNQTDSVPDPSTCQSAAPCHTSPPQCLCENNRCSVGNLSQNAPCDLDRDMCGYGLMCCATCCGTPVPDGGTYDPNPQCLPMNFSGGGEPECPAIP